MEKINEEFYVLKEEATGNFAKDWQFWETPMARFADWYESLDEAKKMCGPGQTVCLVKVIVEPV